MILMKVHDSAFVNKGKRYSISIRGTVKIIDQKGNTVLTIKNSINYNVLASVLYYLISNSLPSVSATTGIVLIGPTFSQTVSYKASASNNQVVFTASVTISGEPVVVNQLLLVTSFYENGTTYDTLLSTVQTDFTLDPGTYTIEWILDFDDPVGVVYSILSQSLTSTLKSVSLSFTPSPSATVFNAFQNNLLWFLQYFPSSATTFSTVEASFSVTNTSSTTTSYSVTVDIPNSPIPVPANTPFVALFTITLY